MELSKDEIQLAIDNKIKDGVRKYGKDFKHFALEIIGLEKMLAPEVKEAKQARLIPLAHWNKYHTYPTVGALRQYRYYNTDNFCEILEFGGINGGKILINEDKYFEWQLKHSKKNQI